jgi:hypothetical protein
MQGALSALLGRDFVIAAFIPGLVFVLCVFLLNSALGAPLPGVVIDLTGGQLAPLTDTIVVGLVSWVLGLLLTVLNIHITQALGGYGKWNPLRLLEARERRRYHSMQRNLQQAREEDNSDNQEAELLMSVVSQFPREENLLPTKLGNALRAFEDYPRVMYGLDPIPGWLHIYSVLPERVSKKIDQTRAYLDFWIHTCALSFLYALVSVVLVIFNDLTFLWVPVVALGVTRVTYNGAVSAAKLWGGWVKSTIDLYLPDLRRQLGFATPANWEEERQMWEQFSQAIIYRAPQSLPERTAASNGPTGKNDDDAESRS